MTLFKYKLNEEWELEDAYNFEVYPSFDIDGDLWISKLVFLSEKSNYGRRSVYPSEEEIKVYEKFKKLRNL